MIFFAATFFMTAGIYVVLYTKENSQKLVCSPGLVV